MIWVLLALAAAVGVVLAERLWLNPETLLTVEDGIVTPGEPLRLLARVERDIAPFVDPAIPGATVEFHESERLLGRATTKGHGVAILDIEAPGGPSDRRFRVVSREAGEALVVKVVAADAPVLVCDLDRTVADISPARYAFTPNERILEVQGASAVLADLARRYALVFLTARDHIFMAKTREWLRMRGLPDGPVILRRRRFWSQSPLNHKLERLEELSKRVRLFAGIGDLRSDMEAYRRFGMKALWLRPKRDPPPMRDVTVVRSWEEIGRILLATPEA